MAEERERGFTVWRMIVRLRRFILPQWGAILAALLLMLGKSGMDLLKPWPLKFAFDAIFTDGGFRGIPLIWLIAGISSLVVGVALVDGLLKYQQIYILNRAGRTIVFELRAALFDHIQRLSLQFHHRRSSGDLLTRLTSDVRALREVLTESFAEVMTSIVFLIGMLTVLFWLDPELTLIAMASMPLLILVLFRYTSRIKAFSRAERKREGALASVAHEVLGTIRLTRVFNQEDAARKRFQAESQASLESGFTATVTEERFAWVVDVLGAIVTAVVLGFGLQRVLAGQMTPGTLIVFVSYTRDFYRPLRTAIKHANKFTRASARAERVVEILDVKEEVADLPGARPAPALQGQIEFQGVSFGYHPEQPALHGIDLVMPAQKVTALVGPTGAGKSTLVSLIPRLYDPTEGAVLIDGQDVRQYTLRSLRGQVSMVLQESVLLRASIAENIAYGRGSATFEEIIAAAKAANAHDFILALPEGYQTEVGERGETLSGGQRQLIAIARAMARNAPILILDEPLTGLDAESAAAVMAALERLMAGKTAIIITHQLALAQRADLVVVMAGGQVVQQGTPTHLVKAPGTYRDLFQTQHPDVLASRSGPRL